MQYYLESLEEYIQKKTDKKKANNNSALKGTGLNTEVEGNQEQTAAEEAERKKAIAQ